MPIGRPLDLTANVATKRISVVATANQTDFTVTGGYRINQLGVYRNGIRLVDGRDFIATDGSTVVLLSGATLDDVIEFQVFDSFNTADAIQTNSSEQTIAGNLTVTGSTGNLFTSNSYNVLELRADENNDGGNDDIIFKFTHDGTFRSEMRYDESSSTLEISTADNRDDFSMDTDGKVTFAKDIATAQDYPSIRPTLDLNKSS